METAQRESAQKTGNGPEFHHALDAGFIRPVSSPYSQSRKAGNADANTGLLQARTSCRCERSNTHAALHLALLGLITSGRKVIRELLITAWVVYH